MKLTGLFLVAAVLLLAVAPSSPLLHNLRSKLAKLLKKGPKEVCRTVYEDRTAPHCETTYEQVSSSNLQFQQGFLLCRSCYREM